MGENEGNGYVRRQTCGAIVAGHNREIKDMKTQIEKLDGRIWWIVATGTLTVLMSAVTLWAQFR